MKFCRLFMIVLFLFGTSSSVLSQRTDYDFQREHIQFYASFWQNPAMRFQYPINQITDVSLSNLVSKNDIYNVQKGEEFNRFSFYANSFKKQANKVIYGMVAYEKENRKNIKWNTLTDWDLLYPYIVADTISDNLRKETYLFEGAYAHKLKQFTLGILAKYKASLSYDKRDPRPQNDAYNLHVSIGASTKIAERYQLGMNLYFDRYQQKQDLSIYTDGGVASLFYLRGLGVVDKKFSTIITKTGGGASHSYKLRNYGGTISLYPVQKGHFVVFSYETGSTELVNTNNTKLLTVSMLEREKLKLEFGYKFNSNRSIKIFGEYLVNKGIEYTYSRSESLISKTQKYKRDELLLGLAWVAKLNWTEKTKGSFMTSVAWHKNEENYLKRGGLSSNEKNYTNLSLGLTKNLKHQFKKSSLLFKLSAKYRYNLDKKLLAGTLAAPTAVETLVEPNYLYQTTNCTTADLLFRYDYEINQEYSLYVKGNATYAFFDDAMKSRNQIYRVGVGLNF